MRSILFLAFAVAIGACAPSEVPADAGRPDASTGLDACGLGTCSVEGDVTCMADLGITCVCEDGCWRCWTGPCATPTEDADTPDGGGLDAPSPPTDGGSEDAASSTADTGIDAPSAPVDAGTDAPAIADAGVPATMRYCVDIDVSNTCDMTVSPTEITIPVDQTAYFCWRNRSADYPVDVWLSYGGGYTDLAPGATWNEPPGHCLGPTAHDEYADVSTACSSFRFLIHCL